MALNQNAQDVEMANVDLLGIEAFSTNEELLGLTHVDNTA